MSRWKGLPESLDQRVRQLVVQLRRLKDHSGLSLASLAAKTTYSKSSWERYLNGKKLPPRDAVEALARVCGADATRLLVLHELAAQAWGAEREAPGEPGEPGEPEDQGDQEEPEGRAESGDGAEPEDGSQPGERRAAEAPEVRDGAAEGVAAVGAAAAGVPAARGSRSRVGPLVALGALAVLVVAGAVLLVVRPWQHDAVVGRGTGTATAGRAANPTPTFTHRVGETFPCHVRRTAGALSAGRSRTATALLSGGVTGWDVVEAQCLLRQQGYDPGPVDGIVGEHTMRAVKRLQSKAGLPTDGIVGPDTWKVLRR